MTKLTWDEVGERKFQTGIDRGVLYVSEDVIVPWNGLTGFDESVNRESNSYYQDGIKYMEHHVLGEFGGTLRALTYPDAFGECIGETSSGTGLIFYDQRPKTFALCYRTRLGDDVDGIDAGYMLHILYNCRAIPSGAGYSAITDTVTPTEFSFTIGCTPQMVADRRPTAHVSIKSTDMDLGMLEYVEEILYGTDTEPPYLPSIAELIDIIETPLVVVDNGDGTWTATGSDRSVHMLSDTAFQLNGVSVTYLDEDTWQIPTTDTEL